MGFNYNENFGVEIPVAYERLLPGCMIREQMFFLRSDGIKAAWQIVYSIMKGVRREMNIEEFSDLEDAGKFLAKAVTISAENAVRAKGFFTIVLSGGRSPMPFMRMLADPDISKQIDWRNVFVFFGDERAVTRDSEYSNYKSAYDIFLSKVSLPQENIFRMNGERGASAGAADYERALHNFADMHDGFLSDAFPRFDFVLLGVGSDGHTASLFPGSSAAEEFDKWVVSAPAPALEPRVERITLTLPVLNNGAKIVLLTTRGGKEKIIDAIIENRHDVEPAYPVARVFPANGELIWCVSEG